MHQAPPRYCQARHQTTAKGGNEQLLRPHDKNIRTTLVQFPPIIHHENPIWIGLCPFVQKGGIISNETVFAGNQVSQKSVSLNLQVWFLWVCTVTCPYSEDITRQHWQQTVCGNPDCDWKPGPPRVPPPALLRPGGGPHTSLTMLWECRLASWKRT